ncbi:acyltransferase [Cesiribacter sp. SM1]|uniref:acyltransferase family protein n=1 Tax=Cesiribacter sp. SM1 TaxID=2861196 RepID=UPI001CD3610B|nr:acyltransferase [Cesiribacter sp. SM1]
MNQTSKPKLERDSNIELLRIALMLMIIGYHLIVHGANVGSGGNYVIEDKSSVAYVLLKSFLVIAVNCFVFISGYYRIKFRIRTFLNIIAQATFYSMLLTLTADLLFWENNGWRYYLFALFPVFAGTWWFITAYLALYIISPLLNNAIDSFNKAQFLFILISITIINMVGGFMFDVNSVGVNNGYSVLSFVHIYLLAQFIRKYANQYIIKSYSPSVYIFSSTLLFLLAFISVTALDQRGVVRLYAYNNPLVFISAVSFFFMFKSLQIKSRFINSISPYVLGVYFFHDHPLTRELLVNNLFELSLHYSGIVHFMSLLIITLLVFTVGVLVDKIRAFLLMPVLDYLILRFNLQRLDRLLNFNKKHAVSQNT